MYKDTASNSLLHKAKPILCVLTFCFLGLSTAFAQNKDAYAPMAEKAFKAGRYYAAAIYYKKMLGLKVPRQGKAIPYSLQVAERKKAVSKKKNEKHIYALAQALRLYHNYTEAVIWYESLKDNPAFPLAGLWYGITLRATQQYEQAQTALLAFKAHYQKNDTYTKKADFELQSCRFALAQLSTAVVDSVSKLNQTINEGKGNYAAAVFDNNSVYFTSTRYAVSEDKQIAQYNNIYQANGSIDTIGNPVLADIPFEKPFHQGTLVFSADKKSLYFTRWEIKGTNQAQTVSESSIWKSILYDGIWLKPVRLDSVVNQKGSRNLHPFVTSDNSKLYFVSDRAFGQGKYDIWYCNLSASGDPIFPAINAGKQINTPQNEQSPYFDQASGRLFYSSDGKVGMGGYDIFQSKLDEKGEFTPAENLGYPTNSAKDDLHFMPLNTDFTAAYLSSDRDSECCLELYYLTRKDVPLVVKGIVLDEDSQKPIADVLVTLRNQHSKKQQTNLTQSDGSYTFLVPRKQASYELSFQKDQYFNAKSQLHILQSDLNKQMIALPPFITQKVVLHKAKLIPHIYYDYGKASLRSESFKVLDSLYEVLVLNPSLVVEIAAHTDHISSDSFNLALSKRRAHRCVQYLLQKGLSPIHLFPKGYGKSQPIAAGNFPDGTDNPAGRQKNRRTEFKVLKVIRKKP